MRRALLALLALACAALVLGSGLAQPLPSVFGTPVDLGGPAAEPSIAVSKAGDVYVAAPEGNLLRGGHFWARPAGDATFHARDPVQTLGSADSDLAISPVDGTVVMTDLTIANIDVHLTKNQGQSWTTVHVADVQPLNDRQWMTFGPDGTLHMVFRTFEGEPIATPVSGGIWIDGGFGYAASPPQALGLVWPVQSHMTGWAGIGRPVIDPSGGIYVPHACATGPCLAVSQPPTAGLVWTSILVNQTTQPAGNLFVSAAEDATGHLYLAWAQPEKDDAQTWNVYYDVASTTPTCCTFGPAMRVTTSGANVMPALVAGDDGRVGIAWYGTTTRGDPATSAGPWYVHYAVSSNAYAANATWTDSLATPASIHNDAICLAGTSCPDGSRDLLDFLSVATDAAGRAHIAFAYDTFDLTSGVGNLPYARVAYVEQTSGSTLKAGT